MIPSTELSLVPLPERARLYGDVELVSALRRRSKFFVTFLGFGELGYQDENAMRSIVLRDLETRSRADTIVNSGTLITAGFHPGIAEVYREARAMGFATTGIHPSIALRDPSRHGLSPYVDEAFFVEDDSWGGYRPGTCELGARVSWAFAVGTSETSHRRRSTRRRRPLRSSHRHARTPRPQTRCRRRRRTRRRRRGREGRARAHRRESARPGTPAA